MKIANVFRDRPKVSIACVVCVASLSVAGLTSIATARDDAGVKQFFLNLPAPSAARDVRIETASLRATTITKKRHVASRRGSASRILTVRAWPSRVRLARASLPNLGASVGSVPAVVSMYNDATLRFGDAIMTTRGLRVFQGSDSFPFRAEDFTTLQKARGLTAMLRRSLADADQNPSGRLLVKQARI